VLAPGRQKGRERRYDVEMSGVRRRSTPAHAMQPDIPTHPDGRDIMMMNGRVFSATLVNGAAASLISVRGMAANSIPAKARNVVLVHGLFSDGSCWSEVIARLQAAGLNATAVQNPLTTLPEAVASAQRVLARQDGPTVLVGHSFSGMIVTEAGMHPNVSALVYVAARARCGRGLRGPGEDISDAAGEGRDRVRRR
jgi:pimeloyl-ACP methyl ester carboxylesterase